MKKTPSIRNKLIGLISITSLSVVVVGLFSIISLKLIMDNFNEQIHTVIPISTTTQQALLTLEEASSSLTTALLDTDTEAIRVSESDFNHAMFEFDMFFHAAALGSETDAFKKLNAGLTYAEWTREGFDEKYSTPATTSTSESDRITSDMNTHVNDFVTHSQEILSLRKKTIRSGSTSSPDQLTELRSQLSEHAAQATAAKEKIGALIQQFLTTNTSKLDASTQKHDRLVSLVRTVTLGAVIFNLITVFGLGIYYINRVVMLPIYKLTKVVNDISTGQLDSKIDPTMLESADEIGGLARAFDRTIVSLKLAMKDQTAGQAKPPAT